MRGRHGITKSLTNSFSGRAQCTSKHRSQRTSDADVSSSEDSNSAVEKSNAQFSSGVPCFVVLIFVRNLASFGRLRSPRFESKERGSRVTFPCFSGGVNTGDLTEGVSNTGKTTIRCVFGVESSHRSVIRSPRPRGPVSKILIPQTNSSIHAYETLSGSILLPNN